ncbi:uncharacterized protein [Arachis hypogaea]|uniref:uncharacterized protein n=1 Tax=Arachis hypogaea TaxID=3818 RepID=UPI003B20C87A
MPSSIVSDHDPRFTSRFWGAFQRAFGTKLCLSTAYHLQTDGQSKKTIQTLEDLLRACVLDQPRSWDRYMPLVEFTYNNSFCASNGMDPYETVYGRKCQSLLCLYELGEASVLGPDLIAETTLHKYMSDAAHVLEPESVELRENITFQATPVKIDDTSMKKLRGKDVPLVKVAWERAGVEEHTWKLESEMRKDYPELSSENVSFVKNREKLQTGS